MTKKCKLISKNYTTDSIGQLIAEETEREVFCDISSVGSSEFLNAGQLGFKPDFRVKIWQNEYKGEDEIVVNSVHYTVYRTYIDRDGRIELYVQMRVGEDE